MSRFFDYRPELRSLLNTLRNLGFRLVKADNGGFVTWADEGTEKLVANLEACDEAHLYATKDGHEALFFLVLGNEPGVIVSDYSYAPALRDACHAATERHYDQWSRKPQPTISLEEYNRRHEPKAK